MKAYKTKASAKRAAVTALVKGGLSKEEAAAKFASLGTVNEVEGGFVAEMVKSTRLENILRKSEMEGACGLVWDIASSMPDAKRKDVIAECTKQGVAFYTARTQYQLWKQAGKAATTEEK